MNVSFVDRKIIRSVVQGWVSINDNKDFWLNVRSAPRLLLALDYDGTLAPFHKNPMKAFPLPGVIEAIKSLKKVPGVEIAVISGRPVYELYALLGHIGVMLVGCHGFESMDTDGNIAVISPDSPQLEGLETAEAMVSRINSGSRMERKVSGLALHTRGMSEAEALAVGDRVFYGWSLLAPGYDLECRRFKGGVEIRAKGRHKGTALSEILIKQPEQSLAVYVGDDETDEDAFRVVLNHGVGIRVGGPTPQTLATEFLYDCREVKIFLEKWVEATVRERSRTKDENAQTSGGFESSSHSFKSG